MTGARLVTRIGFVVVLQACATNGTPTLVPCAEPATAVGAASPTAVASPPIEASDALEATESDATESDAGESVLVDFDCYSTIETKREESLRQWGGGGPFGAAWNVDGVALICSVQVESPCEGTIHVQLHGNSRLLGRDTREIGQGPSHWDVDVAGEEWTDATTDVGLTYETMVMAIGGVVTCDDGLGHYPFADAFIAGFSGGE